MWAFLLFFFFVVVLLLFFVRFSNTCVYAHFDSTLTCSFFFFFVLTQEQQALWLCTPVELCILVNVSSRQCFRQYTLFFLSFFFVHFFVFFSPFLVHSSNEKEKQQHLFTNSVGVECNTNLNVGRRVYCHPPSSLQKKKKESKIELEKNSLSFFFFSPIFGLLFFLFPLFSFSSFFFTSFAYDPQQKQQSCWSFSNSYSVFVSFFMTSSLVYLFIYFKRYWRSFRDSTFFFFFFFFSIIPNKYPQLL